MKNKNRFKNNFIKEYEGELKAFLFGVIGIAGFLFFWFIFPSLFEGGSSLMETSKNIECGNDIQEALHTYKQKMDMHYDLGSEDYKIIFNKGKIQKQYYRDGIQYTAYFNINKTKDGCYLHFFKRGKLEPGHSQTTIGDYDNVILKKCQCQ
jgi:hypothetical protein